jgi:hypothetical protein
MTPTDIEDGPSVRSASARFLPAEFVILRIVRIPPVARPLGGLMRSIDRRSCASGQSHAPSPTEAAVWQPAADGRHHHSPKELVAQVAPLRPAAHPRGEVVMHPPREHPKHHQPRPAWPKPGRRHTRRARLLTGRRPARRGPGRAARPTALLLSRGGGPAALRMGWLNRLAPDKVRHIRSTRSRMTFANT